MKKLLFPIVFVAIIAALTGCLTAEEYYFEARPPKIDSTGIERSVILTNDNFVIQSKVFYRSMYENYGLSTSGSLHFERLKIKKDGSLHIMGVMRSDTTAAYESFEIETDNSFGNLATNTDYNEIDAALKENYFTGPSDDYLLVNTHQEGSEVKLDIYKNGVTMGTVTSYSSKYQPVWHLDSDNELYNFEAVDGWTGSGINTIRRLNSDINELWAFNPGESFIRFPGCMINKMPYVFGINGSRSLSVYRGNFTPIVQNAGNLIYGFDLIHTADFKCFGHVYHTVSDESQAYILALEYNTFRLFKFSSATNLANLESEFVADYTDPNAIVSVKMSTTGVAFILVINGNGVVENQPTEFELFKVSGVESKSYGKIKSSDFDSEITFSYNGFYIVDDEPVLWFNSGGGDNYTDHLLMLKPM